jgi:hypothetical protein
MVSETRRKLREKLRVLRDELDTMVEHAFRDGMANKDFGAPIDFDLWEKRNNAINLLSEEIEDIEAELYPSKHFCRSKKDTT